MVFSLQSQPTYWKVRTEILKNSFILTSLTCVTSKCSKDIRADKPKEVPYYTTLRAESPSIFLDKSGRGRGLCSWSALSLIRRSSKKMDEQVQSLLPLLDLSRKIEGDSARRVILYLLLKLFK